MALQIKRLSNVLGAEVRGVNLAEQLTDKVFDEIIGVWLENLVLVFPDQTLTNEEHIVFSQKFGTINIAKSNQSKILGYFLYFVAMLYGGFFGAGTTIITMLILVQFMGYKSLEAHGTEMTAWIAMSVISSAIFLFYDQVNFIYALIICVSMMLGSSVGSKLAIKKGDKFVKYLVAAFAILIGLKLLIWP